MEDYSDSDTSSESEYESDQGSTPRSDSEEDKPSENLEPELSEEFNNAPWNPQAQLDTIHLAQLYNEIKARAQVPNPTYPTLFRNWPASVTVLARISRAYLRLGRRIRTRLGDRTGDRTGDQSRG